MPMVVVWKCMRKSKMKLFHWEIQYQCHLVNVFKSAVAQSGGLFFMLQKIKNCYKKSWHIPTYVRCALLTSPRRARHSCKSEVFFIWLQRRYSMQDHFLKTLRNTLLDCVNKLDAIHNLFIEKPGVDFLVTERFLLRIPVGFWSWCSENPCSTRFLIILSILL